MNLYKKKAMILAAGYGTRMKEYTKELPKPLLPILGIPMIAYHLFLLYLWKVDYVVINLHYLGDKIQSYLKNFPYFEIHFVEEEVILGTAGGIANAIHKKLLNDYFLILNSDTIFFPNSNDEISSFEFIPFLNKENINNLFFLREVSSNNKEKTFVLLTKINQSEIYKIKIENIEVGKYFYTGMSLFHESFFDYRNSFVSKQMWEEKDFKKEIVELIQISDTYGKIENFIRYDIGNKEKYEEIRNIFIIPEYLQYRWNDFKKNWKEIC